MNLLKSILLGTLLLTASIIQAKPAGKQSSFTVGQGTFLLNGEPFVVKAAELHYPRIPQPYWEHRIKMCKAMGMNTICLYVFWNLHEPQQDRFCWSGQNDVAAFCRLAQKHGMYVIVRPGPYVCAEWEMGGLPWWLLKKRDIQLRQQDEWFMQRVEIFEREVAAQLAPLTIQRGGPIIMLQVENEYGAYGEDKAYVAAIRDVLKKYWTPAPQMFQCDWASNFTKNALDDLVWTMNFGTGANIDKQFEKLKSLRPNAPLMCSEYWSGWFDKWGAKHETRPADKMVAGIDEMLSKGISFSLYMAHGGTSFSHWAGANSPGFSPDVTSYDYDAPINEWGEATNKFHLLRATMQKYSKRTLPAIPAMPAKRIAFPEVELTEYAPLHAGIDSVVRSNGLLTFEQMNLGWGTLLYSTLLPTLDRGAVLSIEEPHDFAVVYVDDQLVGTIDRSRKQSQLTLPATTEGQELRIVLEGMGRINFGKAIKDFKGITSKVCISTEQQGHLLTYTLKNWTICRINDEVQTARTALEKSLAARPAAITTEQGANSTLRAGYYRGWLTLKKTGDTFINMASWGKGQVYVNGHALGRFWNKGPQQTLYLPGCWLKKGRNEIIVLDILGPEKAVCDGKSTPVLDRLGSSVKGADARKLRPRPQLTADNLMAQGTLKRENGWQTIAFKQPKTGRFIAIECLSTYESNGTAAIAELYVLNDKAQRLSREQWTVQQASSEETTSGNHTADKVFDLQESTYWMNSKKHKAPHHIIIDMGGVQTISALQYLPRAEQDVPGAVKEFKVYVY